MFSSAASKKATGGNPSRLFLLPPFSPRRHRVRQKDLRASTARWHRAKPSMGQGAVVGGFARRSSPTMVAGFVAPPMKGRLQAARARFALEPWAVPTAVKTAVLKPLRSPGWRNRSNGVASLCTRLQLQPDNNPFTQSNGVKGIANTMMVAHIATSILEVSRSGKADFDHKIAATHLSRYCAYLVAYVPELLPDDNQWCKSLYKAVQKEGKRALAVAGGAMAVASTPKRCSRRWALNEASTTCSRMAQSSARS
ncbi:hypothetical protein ZWY2020_010334 [Hordeum vulgare]|nr:hypothetical protein ZWY2020_010334 [Hordeum vulgare]